MLLLGLTRAAEELARFQQICSKSKISGNHYGNPHLSQQRPVCFLKQFPNYTKVKCLTLNPVCSLAAFGEDLREPGCALGKMGLLWDNAGGTRLCLGETRDPSTKAELRLIRTPKEIISHILNQTHHIF